MGRVVSKQGVNVFRNRSSFCLGEAALLHTKQSHFSMRTERPGSTFVCISFKNQFVLFFIHLLVCDQVGLSVAAPSTAIDNLQHSCLELLLLFWIFVFLYLPFLHLCALRLTSEAALGLRTWHQWL